MKKLLLLILIEFILVSNGNLPAQNKFLNFSDIHFDPFYDTTLVKKLDREGFDEWESILKTSKLKTFSPYGKDCNYFLFKSTLAQMKSRIPHPDFIIITGDFMSHKFNENYEHFAGSSGKLFRFVEKTIRFTNFMITKYFPKTQIIVTLGNDDSYCGNYMVEPEGKFIKMFYDTWKESINKHADNMDNKLLKKFGYGMVNLNDIEKGKMIILNTIYFSTNYKNTCGNYADDPGSDELIWLNKTLRKCKDRNYKVWMSFHIPPGIDIYGTIHGKGSCQQKIFPTWKKNYNEKFLEIISEYSSIINSTFAGHFHRDDFRVIMKDNNPVSFISITPSISPIYGNNPSYKVFQYDKTTFSLTDYDGYYIEGLTTSKPEWRFGYNFRETYLQNSINSKSMYDVSEKIFKDSTYKTNYIRFYSSGNPKAFSGDYKDWIYNWCALTELTSEEYQKCFCSDSLK